MTPTDSSLADPDSPDGESGLARRVALLAGIALFALILTVPPPADMPPAAWRVAAVAALMAVWWMGEAVPVAATALLPVVLFPGLGIRTVSETASSYANPLIFLFLGGFILALGLERWALHRRIAIAVLRRTGSAPDRIVGGFMLATAGLSMWISNTATAIMMLPIAAAVLARPDDRTPAPAGGDRFAVGLMLAIAYAATIGGLATLIGTPPNALLAAFLNDRYGLDLGFARWMMIGLPVSLILLAVAWLLLTRLLFRAALQRAAAGAVAIRDLPDSGPLDTAEKRMVAVFGATALLWITRPLLSGAGLGGAISDAGIAIAAAIALFALPSGMRPGQRLLDWDAAGRLPWGVLILFGGGLALAAAINDSGLAGWIGAAMKGLGVGGTVLVIAGVTAIVVFLTELTSNTATAATFLPLAAALATGLGADPIALSAAAALAASCAFMMPVATPPNAIVYGSGRLTVWQMASAGFWLNLVAIAVISGAVMLLAPLLGGR